MPNTSNQKAARDQPWLRDRLWVRLCACSASCDLWNGSAPLLPLFFDDFRSEKKICFDVAKQKGSDFTKICIKTRFFWVCRERIYLSTVVGWALSSVGSVRKRWKRKGRNVGRCCFVFSFCWVHSETIQSCCYYWIIVVIYMTFLFQILYTHTPPSC